MVCYPLQSGVEKVEPFLYPVPPMGLEPTTFALGRQRTTIVLRRLVTYEQANQYGGKNRGKDLSMFVLISLAAL